MQEFVQVNFSKAPLRTRQQIEASFDQLQARTRELQELFEEGNATPESLAELARVRHEADAEYERLRVLLLGALASW
jgi:hypothetical protein